MRDYRLSIIISLVYSSKVERGANHICENLSSQLKLYQKKRGFLYFFTPFGNQLETLKSRVRLNSSVLTCSSLLTTYIDPNQAWHWHIKF